jgi:hypothetical protein
MVSAVSREIYALGGREYPSDIGGFLIGQGVRGQAGKPWDCPVAAYLRQETGAPVRVTAANISFKARRHWWKKPVLVSFDISRSLSNFIMEVDGLLWPELER